MARRSPKDAILRAFSPQWYSLMGFSSQTFNPCKYLTLNLSIHASQIPHDWRYAFVNPGAKAPHRTDRNQFRPMCLKLGACRIFDPSLKKAILEATLAHLSQFSLLTLFPPSLTNLLVALVAKPLDLIYLDLFEPFDSVTHRIPLVKLRGYHTSCNELS